MTGSGNKMFAQETGACITELDRSMRVNGKMTNFVCCPFCYFTNVRDSCIPKGGHGVMTYGESGPGNAPATRYVGMWVNGVREGQVPFIRSSVDHSANSGS
jgi:hypothetical protein